MHKEYFLSKNILLEPDVSGKYQPETWTLRKNFHPEPENSPEKQYFALCITQCHLYKYAEFSQVSVSMENNFQQGVYYLFSP